jgi:ribosomal protein L37E
LIDQDQDFYKVCPECAGEYRPDVLRCADCGVPLVHPEEIAFRDARELPISGGLVALRTAAIAWVRALAADLDRKGIRYRVDRRQARSEGRLTLYVRRQDRAAAEAVDAARERIEPPLDREEAIEEPSNVAPFRAEPVTHKVCPRCGGEYRLDAERCADCGDRLVYPEEAEAAAEIALRATPGTEDAEDNFSFTGPLYLLPPSDELVCLCCSTDRPLQVLSAELNEAGIAHRLDPAPYGKSIHDWCLYVLPEDGDAAAAIEADGWGPPIEEVDPAEPSVCPACGTPHPSGALECANCGLGLGLPADFYARDPACPRCGAVVGRLVDRCPNCGMPLPRE